MNSISFSAGKVSLRHNNNYIDIKGNVAKTISICIAMIVIISSLSSLTSNTK